MREPIREPTPQEQRAGRAPEPLRYTGPAPGAEVMPFVRHSLVEWAPTWGGMFVSIGVLLLLSALGVAVGVSSGTTGVAIWGAISVIIAFFVGGWFCGRTLNFGSSLVAAAHGLLVWAVSIVFAIVFAIMTTLLGVSSLAQAARTALVANVLGPITGVSTAPAAAGAAATAVTSSWATFIILLLAVAACVIGAIIGNQGERTAVTHH